MVFFKKKKDKIQDMKDLEAKLWILIKDDKFSIPSNISQLRTICATELTDLKEEKDLIESKFESEVKSGLVEVSPKLIKLLEELVNLQNLLISQNNLISPETIGELNDDKLREYLQGNSQNLSETSTQINKLLEIIESDAIALETTTNEVRTRDGRFIVKTDTIYDTKTNLTWDRDLGKPGKLNWNEARDYANKQGKELPTRNDWWNLTNEIGTYIFNEKEGYPKKIDMEKIGFLNVKSLYWISTDRGIASAFMVSLSDGYSGYGAKAGKFYVACVRRN